jgi:hypothetical protein
MREGEREGEGEGEGLVAPSTRGCPLRLCCWLGARRRLLATTLMKSRTSGCRGRRRRGSLSAEATS